MVELVIEFGVALVFANVLIEQLGAPIPAAPILIVAGALAVDRALPAVPIFVAAFVACTIADAIWYAAGRLYGRGVMKFLCRISLSPDSCVRQTEVRFERWGKLTLVLAKFIPGLTTIVRPLAGAMRLPWSSFLLWNGIGAAFWCAAALGAGMLFHAELAQLLVGLEDLGTLALEGVIALLAAYIALKWWQRQRFHQMMLNARISVERLHWLMHAEQRPIVVDLRSPLEREQDQRAIPGAVAMRAEEVDHRLEQLPPDRDIVFYCSCPNEAAAAYAAQRLARHGYTRVHALLGGMDAWIAAGYEVSSSPHAGSLPQGEREAVGSAGQAGVIGGHAVGRTFK